MIVPSIGFSNDNISFISNSTIELQNSSYKSFKKGEENIVINSEKGNINIDNQDIYLHGKVEGQFNYNGKTFNLRTQNLISKLMENSIVSNDKTFFEGNGIEIVSSSIEITQRPEEGIRIIFKDADLDKINSEIRIDKGKAKKIEFLLEKNLMLMEGNAELYEDNMKIISDEILYSLKEDRILKSVNAKIINNL